MPAVMARCTRPRHYHSTSFVSTFEPVQWRLRFRLMRNEIGDTNTGCSISLYILATKPQITNTKSFFLFQPTSPINIRCYSQSKICEHCTLDLLMLCTLWLGGQFTEEKNIFNTMVCMSKFSVRSK